MPPPQENLTALLAPRRVVYKKVKIAMPHCPICKEQLEGNNSIALPWRCACGEWECEYSHYQFTDAYKIKMTAL